MKIHYVREGSGDQPLLLLPGALGSATSDFLPQLEGLSKVFFRREATSTDHSVLPSDDVPLYDCSLSARLSFLKPCTTVLLIIFNIGNILQ